MTATMERTGYVILNEDGEAVAYCDEDYAAAEILREAVFGDSIVPAEDYEEQDDAWTDVDALADDSRRREDMTREELQEIADCVTDTLTNDADSGDGYDWDSLGYFLALGGFPMTNAESRRMGEDGYEEHLRREVRQAAKNLGVTVNV